MDLHNTPRSDIIKQILQKQSFAQGNEDVLWWATINGDNRIIKLLIATNQSSPDTFPLKINKYWNMALRHAAKYGHTETVKILLDAGADDPSHDNITVTRNSQRLTTDYTIEISPECAKAFPERYNVLLLDWIMDNCDTAIFDIIKTHIEKKDPSFTYTKRDLDPDNYQYLPRYHKKPKARRTAAPGREEAHIDNH